jgi:hypothetical protein
MKLLPVLGSDLSGSLAGITAGRSRGGLFLRAKTVGTKPTNPAQRSNQQALQIVSTWWSSHLTSAQRTGWNNYAQYNNAAGAFGQRIQLSGFNLFCRVNLPVVMYWTVSNIFTTAPGAVPLQSPLTVLAMNWSAGGSGYINMTNATQHFQPPFIGVCFVSQPKNAGVTTSHRQERFYNSVARSSGGANTMLDFGGIQPYAPNVKAGQKSRVRAYYVINGNLSAEATFDEVYTT